MGLYRKVCYTIECDMTGCTSLRNKIEDFVGPLDGLTNTPDDAEYQANSYGFVRVGVNKWCCPSCAKILGYKPNTREVKDNLGYSTVDINKI